MTELCRNTKNLRTASITYDQLYDRYTRQIYDVVPYELLQNVHEHILKTLRELYQIVVVERGKVNELTGLYGRVACAAIGARGK